MGLPYGSFKVYVLFYWQDLTTVLESELSGAAKEVVTALLYSPVTYDVKSLSKAFEDQDYDTIVSIIISSRCDHLMDVKEEYSTGKWNIALLHQTKHFLF